VSRLRLVAALVIAALALAGCGFKGAYSLPLPGGNAGGSHYTVTAVFDDVEDLVQMSAVRVNDVAVGDVTGINYDAKANKARVTMRVRSSVRLPANTVATLEQTTLLGEKYIALGPPAGQPGYGRLRSGAVIPDSSTADLPDVEQVFGVLSAVLNGGDLQDLQTIDIEISKALGGRETAVRAALHQLDVFVSGLDSQRQQIVHALDELNRFSGALAKQTGTIATALDNLGPGLKVLADERSQFTGLLADLSKFGKVATRIITASRQQTVAGFRSLVPILHHLRAAGSNLPHALELLITYPFPRNIDKAIPGDYNGLKLSFTIDPLLSQNNADPLFCALQPTRTASCNGSPGAGTAGGGLPLKLPKLPKVKVPKVPVPLPTPTELLHQLLTEGLPGASS
jgi:phospholipid/cholesterol/gamma-HCH transport system substrate-binding protein